MKTLSLVLAVAVMSLSPAFAGEKGPCKQIKQACESAGFVKGAWKQGNGLWRDCINPIMQGMSSAQGATKPLPSVDAGVVSACKAKHPKFGSRKS